MEKLKNIKHLKLKLLFSLVFLILMVVQIGPFLLLADEKSKNFSYEYKNSYLLNTWYNGLSHTYAESYLDDSIAYCVDPANAWPDNGSDLQYLRDLSSFSTAVLLYGYPNSSPDELGVLDKEEAGMATQYALWAFGKSAQTMGHPEKNDSQKTDLVFDLKNVEPKPGHEEEVERVLSAAKRLINRAKNAPYYANPKLDLDKSSSNVVIRDSYILVGPYKVNATGFEISDIIASIPQTDGLALLSDVNGNVKDRFANGEGVYIMLPKEGNAKHLRLNVNAVGSYWVGKVYGTGNMNDGKQDYTTLEYSPVNLNTHIDISTPDLVGNIQIEKVDNNNNPLEGVTFEVTDQEGKVVKKADTDANGILEVTGLKIGNYKVREVEGLDGYIWEREAQDISVNFNKTSKIKFVNIKIEGGIRVVKIDEYRKPLKGVEFELLDSNKNRIGNTVTTNSDGIAYIPNVPVGTYYLKEVSVPQNIHLSDKYYQVEVTRFNETVEAEIKNYYLKGRLTIIKVDENKQRIKGVKFNILDENNNIVATVETNENGEATTGYLENKKYFVQEVSVPNNKYVLNTNKQEVTMAYKDQSIEIENKLSKGRLKIIKTDEIGNKLKDVKFEVRRFDDDVLVDTITTDENGEAITKYLELGSYYYKEVSAPNYVEMDTNPYSFDITQNEQVITKEIKNKCKAAAIVIEKFDEAGTELAGVEFDLYQIVNGKETVIEKLVTNEKGMATSRLLLPGTYYLRETKAPATVVISKEAIKIEHTFEGTYKQIVNDFARGILKIVKTDEIGTPLKDVVFEIKDSSGKVVDTITTDENGIATSKKLVLGKYTYNEVKAPNYVQIDNNSYTFDITQNEQVITKEIQNKCKRASIVIEKLDEAGSTLSGVEFDLYQIVNGKESLVEKLVTNENGLATSKLLLPGTYYLRETKAPATVVVSEEIIKIEHTFEGTYKQIVNDFARGTLKIIKTDENASPIKDVVFEIKDSSGKVVDTVTTDEEGIAISKKLVLGNYTYSEIKAPEYVVKDSKTYEFSISENNQVIEKNVINELVKGSIKILKVDEDKKPIADVTFKIFDANKKEIAKAKTDKNGIATFNKLSVGVKYYYQETDAPVKFVQNNELNEFTLKIEEKDITVTFENKLFRKPVTFKKVDTDGNAVPNVTFNIYASDKKTLIAEGLKTDENGYVTSEPLPIGKYYYQETSAPDIYIPNTDLIDFAITKDSKDLVITVINEKLTGKLIITKIDKDTKKTLSGVTFEIYDAEGKLIKELVTDEKGTAMISDLYKGKYYLKETKTLDNYILDDSTYEFNITKNGQEAKVTITNEVKKLPQTGGFLSTDLLIVIIVTVVSVAGYLVISIIVKNKKIQE